ncbi:MAG: YraN family protein [Clostridiales Family XIII bacterium]|jgi:putative endonuclease|nr:YraN family protein [Clostridiales Family XIII bacterium]
MKPRYFNSRNLGALGERKAAEYLRAEGYEILWQNFSCSSGEIDIIAHPRGENVICFAEVKTRRNSDYGRPAEAVTRAKQRHIRSVATFCLLKEWDHIGVNQDTNFRFDVLEVDFESGAPRVNHIPAAFY